MISPAQNDVDVVLVDTAGLFELVMACIYSSLCLTPIHDICKGRMQNNTKLMQELAQLVGENNPDLCLFVGEALVGNDGVDQLVHFNKVVTGWRFRLLLLFPP